MPLTPAGVVSYFDNFTANGIVAGFDINQSGYNENVSANVTIKPIPWSTQGTYAVVVQTGGLNPIQRSYQATLYRESDYGALRALVGFIGTLTTVREQDPNVQLPNGKPAILTGMRRANFQYAAWPTQALDNRDLQTVQLDFTLLAS